MIGGTALAIARVLAAKKSRATYLQVGQAIGWGHPTGRGLGKHLYELLHYCKDNDLPPLTTILVKKGEKPIPIAHNDLHLPTLKDVINGVAGYFSSTDGYLSNQIAVRP